MSEQEYSGRQEALRRMAMATLAAPVRYPASVERLAAECVAYGMPTTATLLSMWAKDGAV
jgi:hypothetical protein